MPHPYLIFCPYLPLTGAIEFDGWRIGQVSAFDTAWSDPRFRGRSLAFLEKFTDAGGKRIERPALVGRLPAGIDGTLPTAAEIDALEGAISFAFLDSNPRYKEGVDKEGWRRITADNTTVFIWPIDLDTGHVTIRTGGLLRTLTGGFQIDDEELEIRSPLEVCMAGAPTADPEVLTSAFDVCLFSARHPGSEPRADRIRTAIRWLTKAWKNSESIGMEDRVVFVKTGFEALTASSNSRESARRLRDLFESLPDKDPSDADTLIWSPTENPKHQHTYKGKTEDLTDLEHWFMALAGARNTIIHEGVTPPLTYTQPGSGYEGPLFNVGELVLRAAIKASFHSLSNTYLWRSIAWRRVRSVMQKGTPPTAP